jgi:hypothetical protein
MGPSRVPHLWRGIAFEIPREYNDDSVYYYGGEDGENVTLVLDRCAAGIPAFALAQEIRSRAVGYAERTELEVSEVSRLTFGGFDAALYRWEVHGDDACARWQLFVATSERECTRIKYAAPSASQEVRRRVANLLELSVAADTSLPARSFPFRVERAGPLDLALPASLTTNDSYLFSHTESDIGLTITFDVPGDGDERNDGAAPGGDALDLVGAGCRGKLHCDWTEREDDDAAPLARCHAEMAFDNGEFATVVAKAEADGHTSVRALVTSVVGSFRPRSR